MTPQALEVVGRAQEIAAIQRFAAGPRPAALVLQGEPGIGKTTLWQTAVAAARAGGGTVLAARPAEAEAGLAFSGLSDLLAVALDSVADELPTPQLRALRVALLLEAQAAGRLMPDSRAVGAGLLSALKALGRRGPVLVAVDDVQWLDPASVRALAFALRRLGEAPVVVLLSRRADSDDPLPIDLARTGLDLTVLDVGPLDEDGVHHLVAARVGPSLGRSALRRVHEISGGNPMFALELARALMASGLRDLSGPLPIPTTLRGLVGHRLAALPAPARALVAVVAALPHPDAARLHALGIAEAAVDAAVDGGVLRRDGERIAFVHPLLASAASAELTTAERRALHRRLAEATDDPEERGHHLAAALDEPDPVIAALLDAAALRAAARGAVHAAADFSAHARRLTPGDDLAASRRRAASEAAHRRLVGEQIRAREVLDEEIVRCGPGSARALLLYERARVESWGIDWHAAVGLLEQALGELGDDDERLHAEASLHLAIAHGLIGEDLAAITRHATSAAIFADAVGERAMLAEALALQARTAALAGREHGDLVESALALEDADDGPSPIDRPSDYVAEVRWWQDRPREALATLERIAGELVIRGEETSLAWTLGRIALVRCSLGTPSRALADAERGRDLALRSAQTTNVAVLLAVEVTAAAELGDEDRARAAASEALRIGHGTARVTRLVAAALGRLELSLGRYAAAHEQLGALVDDVRAVGIREPGALRFVPDAVEALAGLGRLDEAASTLGWYEALAVRLGRRSSIAACARCRGLLATAAGDRIGVELLERAVAHGPFPLDRARTLLALGAAQRRALQRRAARSTLESAASAFDAIEAGAWAARARDEIGRIGGRPAAGEDLTETERRVAELVAQGLSNREVASALFVSAKTVEFHLRNVFRKRGVRSRVDLARRG